NSVRSLMEMEEVRSAEPIGFLIITVLVAVSLLTAARLLIALGAWISGRLQRYIPQKVSIAISVILVALFVNALTNEIVARGLLSLADGISLAADQYIEHGISPPLGEDQCGGPESLVPWPSIGRQGKLFLTTGPTSEQIQSYSSTEVKQPIRVYVGMRSADDEKARAKLALQELIRVGGFERSMLIVATPTGTGWLDEGAVDSVEYLHRGDTAIVSTQYSYLPSWITLLVDPPRAKHSATALFDEIYAYWTKLPKDQRPKLYLFGLSLGAYGCEQAADLMETFEDPIQGALWSGTPFPSSQWKEIVSTRNPGSPAWLPQFRDGRMVRFHNQTTEPDVERPWGPIRNLYLQHASDPMVWFSPSLAWQRPSWLIGTRGEDVSPYLRWYPIITFLQVAFDLPLATTTPIGYGHNYSPDGYINGWVTVSETEGWTDEDLERLKKALTFRTTSSPPS
ncbi:MAG: alpha/beta-hydrolase family protein, partial [Planctomycetota bacterium]